MHPIGARIRGSEPDGGSVVACAAVMPLLMLALAVGADYWSVSRFKMRVQLAAEAASIAAAEAISAHVNGSDADDASALAKLAAAQAFAREAPREAIGAPTVAAGKGGSIVGYAGFAPSSFGAILGYSAINVSASIASPVSQGLDP